MRIDNKITTTLFNAFLWVLMTPIIIAFILAYYSDNLTTRMWNGLIKKPRPDQWSKWFAWYPVECKDGGYQWLQTVYRKPWTFHEIIEYRVNIPNESTESKDGNSNA